MSLLAGYLTGVVWRRSAALALIGAVSLCSLPAQTIMGRISGTVTDSSKAVIPGATVTVVNDATKLTRTAVTDDNGFYVVTNLPVGNYSVTAELPGFKKTSRTGFDLVADGRLTADLVLEPGEISDISSASGPGRNIQVGLKLNF
ncbi:MAG TPA: carboxypeptidase-like regulatory domain-containing protein [Acidobacteriota bacterium]|jgi:hypothetical protein